MDNMKRALIAVGAAFAANCQPRLAWHISKAREAGADEKDLVMAIEVAEEVRTGAANRMDKFARTANGRSINEWPSNRCTCGC